MQTDKFTWIEGGGVASAKGFLACGVAAGIKTNRDDMALLFSEEPDTSVAGIFTLNKVAAAPVLLGRKRVARGKCRGVVVNAGCSNACTGEGGYADAVEMARLAAEAVGVPEEQMLCSSTGTIGRRLPMQRIAAGIALAKNALRRGDSCRVEGGSSAARAIMTTDTVPKEAALKYVNSAGETITIGGMCKGAGMICPNMATMLCYITTDAAVAPDALQQALVKAAAKSFNRITVDGDQSTSDTMLVFANNKYATDLALFTEALTALAAKLARKIVEDGEGATKFVAVSVSGAASAADALMAARAIANSPLFKTACFGADPNWGRVICAAGYSGAEVDAMKTRISFDDVLVYDRGTVADASTNERLKTVMSRQAFAVRVDLGLGGFSDEVYTCDFSPEYVRINSDYTT